MGRGKVSPGNWYCLVYRKRGPKGSGKQGRKVPWYHKMFWAEDAFMARQEARKHLPPHSYLIYLRNCCGGRKIK